MFQKILKIFYIVILILCTFNEFKASDKWTIPKENFIGTWKGEGRIIVAWCEQKKISFEVQIDTDGNVSGKIGDAHIRHGNLRLNNIIYRWLGNREYIIDAELSNYLIEKEKIRRESIRIFLDYKESSFTGGFHTSGSKFGGKEKMVLSGSRVKLVKIVNYFKRKR